MARALTRRAGAPPRGVTLPIWAWTNKPDLRRRTWLPPGTRGVRIELEVPKAETLASDFERFQAVLQRRYLEISKRDAERFERALARSGVAEWPHTAAIRTRIESSWDRIFKLGAEVRDPKRHGPLADVTVQVVFWQLRREQVVRIEPFVAPR